MLTKPTKIADIKRSWHLVDLKDKILGRIAVQIAHLLLGKGKPYFVKNLDCGDHVVVINAQDILVTGKKEKQKIYTRFSGYPGGLKKITFAKLRVDHPTEIIRRAVSGMLPKNKLRDKMLKRLYLFPGEEHPYEEKFKIHPSASSG
jgi:large subunit ribosomal protein L13